MKLATVTRSFAKYLVLALMASACTEKANLETQAPINSEPVVSQPWVPGSAIVEFDETLTRMIESGEVTKVSGMQEMMQELGIVSLERVFPDAGEFEPRHRREGLHRFYYVTFAREIPVTKAVTSIGDLSGVVSVSPDWTPQLRGFFNDPYLSRQWHLVNTSSPSADIHVQEVWEQYTVGDSRVVVAIFDDPVQYNHEDLSANMWTDEAGHHGYNPYLSNYVLNYEYSDDGHGTHVAGVVAAVNNNGKGVSSMAGGDAASGKQGVRLMSIPCLATTDEEAQAAERDNNGRRLLSGYTWAADHGAVISQNSWGYSADGCLGDVQDGRVSSREMAAFKNMTIESIPSLKRALDYFIQYAGCDKDTGEQLPDSPMKGGLVIFAAGNEGHMGVDYDPICAYDPVISVGAFGPDGSGASYSTYGNWVDIAAPGGEGYSNSSIWSTVSSSRSTSKYEGTGWAGTSMASPHVSGAAALIVSYFGGPGFTADQCREILFGGLGSTVGGRKPVGKRLNVLASFQYGEKHYPRGGAVEALPPVVKWQTSQVTVKAHESASVQATAHDPNGDAMTFSLQPGSGAASFDQQAMTLSISGWKASPGTYEAVLTATDQGGLSSSATLTYTLLPNHAPQKRAEMENHLLKSLQRADSINLDAYFADEDGEVLTYSAVSSEPESVNAVINGNTLTVYPAGYGLSRIEVTARDFLGKTASASFLVSVINPQQPVSVSPAVVSNQAQILVGAEALTEVTVKLFSPTGALLLEKQVQASAFAPIPLDAAALAPGRYTLLVAYGGEEYKVALVKY